MSSKPVPLPPNFWLPDPIVKPASFPDVEIAAIETDYGIRLPPILIEMWKTMPGTGQPRKRYIEWEPHEEVEKHFRGRIAIHFRTTAESCRDATDVVYDSFCELGLHKPPTGWLGFLGMKLGLHPKARFAGLFAIGDDEYGDDTLCLDYRKTGRTGTPSVTLSHFHCPQQHVSDSLEAFVARLRRYESDDCYCLEWAEDRESLWQVILKGFGLDPHPRGFASCGYHPVWHDPPDHQVYFHLSPNIDDIEEPFIDEPPDRWILRIDAVRDLRPTIQQTLDQLGLKWKLVFETPLD